MGACLKCGKETLEKAGGKDGDQRDFFVGIVVHACHFRNDLWNTGSVTALLLLTLMFVITWLTDGFNTESETSVRGTSL